MTDRETPLLPLKEPFAAGRSALEQPGLANTPLAIERERALHLGAELADYSWWAPGPQAVHELISGGFGPVVARVSAMQVDSRDGFRVLRVRNQSATVAQVGILPIANRLTFAVPIACSVQSITGVPDSILATVGDAAAGFSSFFFYLLPANTEIGCNWYIPPGRVLIIQNDTANLTVNASVEVTQPRT